MITVTIILPKDTSPDVVDQIEVKVLDNPHIPDVPENFVDRRPKITYLEGVSNEQDTAWTRLVESPSLALIAMREGPATTFWVPSHLPGLWIEAAPWAATLSHGAGPDAAGSLPKGPSWRPAADPL